MRIMVRVPRNYIVGLIKIEKSFLPKHSRFPIVDKGNHMMMAETNSSLNRFNVAMRIYFRLYGQERVNYISSTQSILI